jgi:hypothetical protein
VLLLLLLRSIKTTKRQDQLIDPGPPQPLRAKGSKVLNFELNEVAVLIISLTGVTSPGDTRRH